jgi:hypothetical protein
MKTVKIGISRMTKAQVLQLVADIIAAGTGNPDSADATPSLAELTTRRTEAVVLYDGVSQDEAALAAKRTELEVKFTQLRADVTTYGHSVATLCGFDRARVQALGLDLVANAAPVGPLLAPANLRSVPGLLEGTVELDWESVNGRPTYFAECGVSAAGPWTQFFTGRGTKATCPDITPGTEYYFRVRAHGKAGYSPWSDITRRRAS